MTLLSRRKDEPTIKRKTSSQHFILMGIRTPVMDGNKATGTIRALPDETLPGIPIIAMTANVFMEDEEAVKKQNCRDLSLAH